MREINAMVVKPGGTFYFVTIPPGQFAAAFSEHCGARLFDCVAIHPKCDVWVDDEGLINGSELNPYVTVLRNVHWRTSGSPLAGTALITGGANKRGDSVSLDPVEAEKLAALFGRLKTIIDRHSAGEAER